MINKVKKYDNLIIFILLLLISIGTSLSLYISTGDIIWNFNNVNKITNGYKMYTDINIIITPIFFYIVSAICKIVGSNILIYKILGTIMYSFTGLIIYNIFKSLNISKKKSFYYLMLMQTMLYVILTGGTNYNFLAIIFTLLGILLLIKNKSKYDWILQGIICYLILFTKQNIGVYYIASVIIVEFIIEGINKNTFIKITKQFLVTLILSILNLLFMYFEGNLFDFINYTILGIGEFTHNFYIDSYVILLIGIDIVTFITTIFINKKKLLDNKQNNNLIILSTFSIMMSFVIYPIANLYHIKFALIIPLMILLYILHIIVFEQFNLNKLLKVISMFIFIVLFILSSYFTYYFLKNAKFELQCTHPYYGGLVEKKIWEKIEKIDKYIIDEEKIGYNVIILSKEASIYMLPLCKNNGIFDLPFKGNLGKDGEEGLIDKISKLKSSKILITKEDLFWQESEKANDYVRQNYTKIGEIEEFEIYE